MSRDADHQPPGNHPYRARPPTAAIAPRADGQRGDAAILGGVAAVGAMPFLGLALDAHVESWELGVGAVGVLLAGWALVDEALGARTRLGDGS